MQQEMARKQPNLEVSWKNKNVRIANKSSSNDTTNSNSRGYNTCSSFIQSSSHPSLVEQRTTSPSIDEKTLLQENFHIWTPEGAEHPKIKGTNPR